MTLIKIIIIYIVAFELWRWCSVKPIRGNRECPLDEAEEEV